MDSRGFAARLAAVLLAGSALVTPAPAAAAFTTQDVWCLGPQNRARVVSTAVTLGYGEARGGDHARIRPNGAPAGLSLDEWRGADKNKFDHACGETFKLYGGAGAESSELERVKASIDHIDDGGGGNNQLVSFLAGLGVAAAGSSAGYWFSKRSRTNEREFAQALALRDDLNALLASTEILEQRARSGTLEGDHSLPVRMQAVELLAKLPPTAPGREDASNSLLNLIRTIETRDAERIARTRKDVGESVGALVSKLNKDLPQGSQDGLDIEPGPDAA
jgi:hypothetical protein